MTSVALSCNWYPHAISLTVTGIPSGLNFSFANTTCSANRLTGSNAQSNSGSDPNCTTRVTYFALGLEKSEAKRASRRVFQMFGSSHPNQMRACTPKPLFHAASTTSSLRGGIIKRRRRCGQGELMSLTRNFRGRMRHTAAHNGL